MAAPLKTWIVAIGTQPKTTLQNFGLLTWCRTLRLSRTLHQDENEEIDINEETDTGTESAAKRRVIDPDTSIRYLNSKEYAEGYRGKPVWYYYRRNFKGQILPPTRKTCIRKGVIATASPCPICRDEYLVLDARNTKLLDQFISPYSGEIFDSKKTGLCQKQHHKLMVEVMKAWDEGLIEMKLPFRTYDYDEYKN